jgi:hypothetical protein
MGAIELQCIRVQDILARIDVPNGNMEHTVLRGVGTIPQTVKCQGCKGAAREVDHKIAGKLRGWNGGGSEASIAFECSRCEVIIFEDELDEGRFVPPRFRVESTDSDTYDEDRFLVPMASAQFWNRSLVRVAEPPTPVTVPVRHEPFEQEASIEAWGL